MTGVSVGHGTRSVSAAGLGTLTRAEMFLAWATEYPPPRTGCVPSASGDAALDNGPRPPNSIDAGFSSQPERKRGTTPACTIES